VHRDIKSENVFRTASGIWKLGDFGSALRLGDERLLAKQVLKLEGTFSFAPPEYIRIWSSFSRTQLLAATTFKVGVGVGGGGGTESDTCVACAVARGADVAFILSCAATQLDSWSMGALAYDVLCGRAPFAADESISREDEGRAILTQVSQALVTTPRGRGGGRGGCGACVSLLAQHLCRHAGLSLRHLLACGLRRAAPCCAQPLPCALLQEPEYPSGLSYDAVSFMMQALEKNPQKRLSVPQLLAHPWFDNLRRQQASSSSRGIGNGSSSSSNGNGTGAHGAVGATSSNRRKVSSKRSKHTGSSSSSGTS
jgi:serine/threonine protein kinase